MVEVPYVGSATSKVGKQLIKIGEEICPNTHIQILPKPPRKISNFFPKKDPVPKNFQSRIVYHVKCSDCNSSYIGETTRQGCRRLKEHGAPQKKLPTVVSQPQPSVTTNTLRRSARNRGRVVNYRSMETLIEDDNINTIEEIEPYIASHSAIHQHELTYKHKINWEDWEIISKDSNSYRLRVRESLHILAIQPELNKTVSSVPLIIHPEGLGRRKPKVKIKLNND
ncbi:unnamed protein product [Rotaria sordida]|uniref:Uncharacterized protein n=1 Tax=Rotaria sordida TaxID=392033 RepID=A0A820G263_9BILA|nr:unnamed protein product [Rotaria sordida]CAF4270022.1 unnamed protein product [Rotaria sordida]